MQHELNSLKLTRSQGAGGLNAHAVTQSWRENSTLHSLHLTFSVKYFYIFKSSLFFHTSVLRYVLLH